MSNLTNNVFASGISIRDVPLTQTNPGEVFWVNNSGVSLANNKIAADEKNAGTFKAPFLTVDYAIGKCTASRGDIIFVMPGHNEGSATASAEVFDLDVAGVAIIGLGQGSLRPTFDLDEATVSIACDSANNIISNIIVRASVTVTAVGIDLTATCNNLTLDKISFQEEAGLGGADEFVDVIQTFTTDAGNDGLVVNECDYLSSSIQNESFISLRSAMHGMTMTNNRIQMGKLDAMSVIGVVTAADIITGLFVVNNKIVRLQTQDPLFFEGTSNSCTGMFADNYFAHADIATAIPIPTGSAIGQHNNLYSEAVDVSGFVLPVIGSDA